MLESEVIEAKQLAYDRPSEKLLSFLGNPQNNNFVVFKDYFVLKTHKSNKSTAYNSYNLN